MQIYRFYDTLAINLNGQTNYIHESHLPELIEILKEAQKDFLINEFKDSKFNTKEISSSTRN